MNTRILYLDLIILASVAYPAGFSNSLFNNWKGTPERASSEFLLLLALPYPIVVLAVWVIRPDLLIWRSATVPLIAFALLVVPLAFLIEYCIHAASSYAITRGFPRGLALTGFWRHGLSFSGHVLLVVIAVGEEIVYRGVWLSILLLWGLSVPTAVLMSSLAYGLNHLAFGSTTVISKTVTGSLYCSLYILGGRSIWLPIITHVLQNIMLFVLARERHA